MDIAVVGAGYVGVVASACLAATGHNIVCVDSDENKLRAIERGMPTVHERGLPQLLQKTLGVNLRLTTSVGEAVLGTELSVIAVGTPLSGKEMDLRQVVEASSRIGEALRMHPHYHTVVVKSTVLPGTTEDVILPLLERVSGKKAGVDFGLGMNPEFLSEGRAVSDFMCPDRLVLGGIDKRSVDVLDEMYEPFDGVARIRTTPRTAEMIKYASNCFRATLISFANEIANASVAFGGIDVVDVLEALHASDLCGGVPAADRSSQEPSRLASYLRAGCGFGGSCLPKDVRALIAHAERTGEPMPLLSAVLRVNEEQTERTVSLLKKHFPSLDGLRVAVLGLAFRPGTNDMRESPAIPIIRQLIRARATVVAYDPIATAEARRLFDPRELTVVDTIESAVDGVQGIIIVTRWTEFRRLPELLRHLPSQPVVVDARRMLDKRSIPRYEGIGL